MEIAGLERASVAALTFIYSGEMQAGFIDAKGKRNFDSNKNTLYIFNT